MTIPDSLDRIEISNLVVNTVVGALPIEREQTQPIRIDLTLSVDLRPAGSTDELADTVHYGEVAGRVADAIREAKDVLLERLADRAAETSLSFAGVEAVEVTITKLRPPIPEMLDTVSVRIRRVRADMSDRWGDDPRDGHVAVVALGSNLGDRRSYLRHAVARLGDVVATSQVFETDPVGGPDDQGAYLNMVVAVRTPLDPFAFLRRCRQIEAEALRQRQVRWGPRTLDVDILFFDNVSIDSPELIVPHPRIKERRFVLAPLAEVAPDRCPSGWEERLPTDGVRAIGPLDG
jgi:dihydroneopterin aldolase / 2-amino-4-hydroxy-6-hydroxymethyldihydropteridine diphosphokinase